jgi:hypothetical protein
MKKIVIAIVGIAIVVGLVMMPFHVVKMEYNYKLDKGAINLLTGKTKLTLHLIETRMISGEILTDDYATVNLDMSVEDWTLSKDAWQEVKYVFR